MRIHAMILVLFIFTPFTMSYSIQVFHHFRIAQARLMLLAIIQGAQLSTLSGACGSDLDSHSRFASAFFLPECVYIRFTHIQNLQPEFYIGSATCSSLKAQSHQKVSPTHQRIISPSRALSSMPARQKHFFRLGTNLGVYKAI